MLYFFPGFCYHKTRTPEKENKPLMYTGKNILVGQSGGPTAVINASLAGVLSAARQAGVGKIYGMRYGLQGLLEGKIIDLEPLTSEKNLLLLQKTPAAYLGSCRVKLPKIEDKAEVYEALFAFLMERDIGAVFYIGGNDSMDAARKLSAYAARVSSPIRFIGVPKTIDNDMACTDHTPGFGSAARYIACVTREVVQDALVYDQKRITIMEIMGRDAGWLTGAAALAWGANHIGPDFIYLPETPLDLDEFCERAVERQRTRRSLVIAVSEGVRATSGHYVCEATAMNPDYQDAFGHRDISGTARALCELLALRCGCKARAVEVNVLQRCAAHYTSATDVREAFAVGEAAVRAAMAGHTGVMPAFERIGSDPYACRIVLRNLGDIANAVRHVPLEWIKPGGAGLTDEFLQYVRPLADMENDEEGLPALP